MSTRDVFGSYLLDYSGRSNLSGGYLAILQTKNTAILEGVGFREKSPKLKKNSPSRPWTDPLASPSSASGAEACGQPDSCRHAPLTTLRSRNLSGSPGAWRGGPAGSWTLELQQSSRQTETPNARRRSDPATGAKATVPVHAGVARGLSATGHSAIQEEQQVVEPAYKVRIGACPRVREAAPSHRGSSQLYRSHLVQDLESPGPDLQAGHPRSNRSSARDTRSDWSRKGISRGWHSTRR